MGTIIYWPPERFLLNERLDSKSDVWGLGITLLETICGKIPFLNERGVVPKNIILLQNMIVNTPGAKLVESSLHGKCSAHLKSFISKCLMEYDQRPKYENLMQEELYLKNENIERDERNQIVANFIKEYKVSLTQKLYTPSPRKSAASEQNLKKIKEDQGNFCATNRRKKFLTYFWLFFGALLPSANFRTCRLPQIMSALIIHWRWEGEGE